MGGLPRLIKPMLASPHPELPANDGRYGWEFKWDGVRAITYASGGRVRLVSRNGHDITVSYPELGVLAGQVRAPVVLDGEIIAIRGGRPDFGLLQSRMHRRRPPAWFVTSRSSCTCSTCCRPAASCCWRCRIPRGGSGWKACGNLKSQQGSQTVRRPRYESSP